jgi:hypothetical protein
MNDESQLNQPIKQEQQTKRHLKVTYPNKRYPEREKFLNNWKDTFSKQWDVCCQWKFQNKLKMYGSIQFESILKSD